MRVIYRLGMLVLALVGLSVFDYSQTPYQAANPVKSVGAQFLKGTKNGSLTESDQNTESQIKDNYGNNSTGKDSNSKDSTGKDGAGKSDSGNIKDTLKDTVQKNQQNISEKQLSEYLSNPQQYYLLAIGNRGDDQHMTDTSIYSRADDTSTVVGTLQYHCAVLIDTSGTQVQKISESAWIKVNLGSNKGSGYVKQKEVEVVPLQVKNPTNDVIRNRIIENSVKYIGLRFVRYGKSLTKGIDCSNFVSQIYGQAGISIKTKPNAIKQQGVKIKESQALPGDVVYYYCNNGGGHVGIYMGNGCIINSAGHAGKEYPEGGVRICRVLYKDREKYEFIRIT